MLINTTEAITEPLTVAGLKGQAHIEHTDSDAELEIYIQAAREFIESEIGGPIPAQTYTWTLDGFAAGEIVLPKHPVQSSGIQISYTDPDGATQVLASSAWVLSNSLESLRSTIKPAYGSSWPATLAGYESVTITFTAGYSEVPKTIVHAISLVAATMENYREDENTIKTHPNAFSASALVRRYRQYR